MHLYPAHTELGLQTLHAFLRRNPLGHFITHFPHRKFDSLQCSHIPFVIDPPTQQHRDGDAGGGSSAGTGAGLDKGVLRGHITRVNPQTRAMIDALTHSAASQPTSSPSELDEDVLVMFNGPVNSYVTPSMYVETKPSTAKVVPTWNYQSVQVYGRCRVYYLNDDATGDYLQKQLEDLSNIQESDLKGTADKHWEVSDAPTPFIDVLKRAIVGIEIKINRIEGRFKLSQDKKDKDWAGVVQGFRAHGSPEATAMSDLVEQHGSSRGLKISK